MAERPTIAVRIGTVRSGDACHECSGGRLYIYAGRDQGDVRVKYLCCRQCSAKPENNVLYVPLKHVSRRERKTSESVLNNVQAAFDESPDT